MKSDTQLSLDVIDLPKGTNDIYQQAVDAWGAESQVNMCAEECIELALACHHFLRNNKDKYKSLKSIVEEIADVELMTAQLKYMMDISPTMIYNLKQKKLHRLKRLLKKK